MNKFFTNLSLITLVYQVGYSQINSLIDAHHIIGNDTKYPNPVKLGGYIQIDSRLKINAITIFDMTGKEILHENFGNSRFNISSENFKPGIYIIKLNTNNKESYIQKLLVE